MVRSFLARVPQPTPPQWSRVSQGLMKKPPDTYQPTQDGPVERFIRFLKEEHVGYTKYTDFDDAARQLWYWLALSI